ncbi:dicarboxylate/amino acid:cation symporter [Vibrio chagasii]|nr:dicarboxylate/amino acid:cation symporter [Vibrio chagasii]
MEAIAIRLDIERLLDTFRTAVNVEGDMIAALVVNGRKQQKTVFEPCTERVCSLENTKFNESSPRCRNGLFIVCQCACSQ